MKYYSFIFFLLFFQNCSNDSWQQMEIENLQYIKESNESFVEPYKLPKVQTVSGKYKFLNREGSSSFGYLFEISIDSLTKAEALKTGFITTDTVEVEGKKQIWGPTVGFDYKFQIEFQFYDKDNFMIYELKDSCNAETGKANIIQREQNNFKPEILKATKKVKAKLYLRDYIQIVG